MQILMEMYSQEAKLQGTLWGPSHRLRDCCKLLLKGTFNIYPNILNVSAEADTDAGGIVIALLQWSAAMLKRENIICAYPPTLK